MFEQLESQHYYSRELISNAIMNRLQSVVSYEFQRAHYCGSPRLGAGEAHACTRSAHAHAVDMFCNNACRHVL